MDNTKRMTESLRERLSLSLECRDTEWYQSCISDLTQLLSFSKDYENRVDIGSSRPFLDIVTNFVINNTAIDKYFNSDSSSSSGNDGDKLKLSLLSIRLLRNLCANVPQNQFEIISSEGLLDWVFDSLLFDQQHPANKHSSAIVNQCKSILQSTQQLLINMIVSNESNQNMLWYRCFPSNFLKLVKYHPLDVDQCTYQLTPGSLMLIYNCLLNNAKHRHQLSESKDLLEQLLFLLEQEDLEETGTEKQQQSDEYHNQIFHWIHLIFKSLFSNDCFIRCYQTLSSNYTTPTTTIESTPASEIPGQDDQDPDQPQDTNTRGRTNLYQIRLLKLLDAMVASNGKNVKNYIEKDSIIDVNCCFFLVYELSVLYNMDFNRRGQKEKLSNTTTLNDYDFQAIFFIIKIFANLTSYSEEMIHIAITKFKTDTTQSVQVLNIDDKSDKGDPNKHDLNTLLRKNGLVAICIGSLHGNYSSSTPTDKDTSNINCETEDKGFKKDLIRILGNLAYKNKANQDEIRELGGIELILNHCRFDVKNPYIKEWSVFAIRNLCEENQKNQMVIENLRNQGVANAEELESLGIKVEMQNGSIKFKSTRPPPNSTNNK
ncbi:hypothetical protein CYY_004539 [Polysphondylium violaceum]|uniref:Ataxin-10 domain-containing protein n=1 Tax=Polysphondylium violaceum TaxID=133409 RepID=A0A8J4PV77_9MYCE|nr:hypothetical protein CYY_004539 [Polysphondylium violaceum]